MNVARAFLPYMRARRTGTISFIGSCYGWRPAPFSGIYVTSKFALRGKLDKLSCVVVPALLPLIRITLKGMSDTLDEEIAPFGLRSICFDSGCFRTPVLGKIPRWKPVIDDYKETGEATSAALKGKTPQINCS